MNLKHTKETVIVVDASDIEKLIHETYNITIDKYDLAEDTESHDSVEQFEVKKELLDEWALKDLARVKSGERVDWITLTLLTDMCNRDIIEEGTYNIHV